MRKFFLIILSLFILSCNDPVFYSISMEELPLNPRISGPSTNFAELNNKMYVAAKKRIYRYDNGEWTDFTVSGRITHLAATTSKLYALMENRIILFSEEEMTEEITIPLEDKKIQGIYASEDILFIGTSNAEIYYLNAGETTPLPIAGGDFSMLCGVASDADNYYLCNKDSNGIFLVPKAAPETAALIANSTEKEFTNIINLNADSIAAMSRQGSLFKVTPEGVNEIVKFSDNRRATSALCVWTSGTWDDNVWTKGTNTLLLVGRQDLTNSISTGYTHGYVEIEFNPETGELIGERFNEPGRTSISSISENTNEHYASSIGKRGINYFYQAPNGILFASLNHGVWSYRAHRNDSKRTWNAEE